MRFKYITMIGMCLCIMAGCSQRDMSKKEEQQKDMAPLFTMQNNLGETKSLTDYKGKKLYIKIWASWCPICLSGLDELNTLKEDNSEYEVVTMVAPLHQSEMSQEDFMEWFTKLEYKNINVLFDKNGEYLQKIGVRGYPTSVFIDKEGNLIKVQPGHLNKDQIDQTMADIE
ncbi:redoxin family protein [Amedibacillus sp. YH-ame6]